jgi:hypothetical protein
MNEKEIEKIIKRLLELSFSIYSDVNIDFYYFDDKNDPPYRIEVRFNKEFVERKNFDKFGMGVESHLESFVIQNWYIREGEIVFDLFYRGK